MITPADIPLPEFLDPALSFLSENLPQPVYSMLISIISYGLALVSALLTLLQSLIFDSSNWNAQTILPPLLALLSAYFAIVSLYRTTTWMLRTTFWFIKWGTLLAAMAAGAGWLLGNGGNAVGTQSVVNTAAGVILDMINHEEKSDARSTRSSSGRKRPKPWDSFKDHRDWQYKEKDGETTNHDAQILMDSVLSAAGSAIKGSSWWGVFNGGGGEMEEKGSDSSSVSR
ncbi:MAG: hypothetical protein NXY57DRAFT_1006777 [Lentinula lateritia]|uniref:MARVEL domain-containing protein n=1 Tax=Lentinula lateritia TaxID=40482 RepID=A0ABQ8VPP5_9AGAR|nr:MAG: hypothetical protein NXY57DRAFT_1006777 [Lentinula lateritia]KAJ4498368.1 hypothetical protein C8R41DRAFT_818921 [Lentinula lateritia]